MPRAKLDMGLQNVQAQIVHVGNVLEGQLANVSTVLTNGELVTLHNVLISKSAVDALCISIEQQALRLIILQQPLGGQDLRFLTSALFIGDYLKRIADAQVEIARSLQQASELYHQTFGSAVRYSVHENVVNQQGAFTDVLILRGLRSLSEEVEHMIHATMIAFAQRDSALAQTIDHENLVAMRYAPIGEDIVKMQASVVSRDATFVQRITCLLWVAHKLAEIATCLLNICTRIVFIVEG